MLAPSLAVSCSDFLADDQRRFHMPELGFASCIVYLMNARSQITALPDNSAKGNCDEFLGLWGLLRCFVATKLTDDPVTQPFKRSSETVCNIVDCLLALKRCLVSRGDGADRSDACVRRHSPCTWKCAADWCASEAPPASLCGGSDATVPFWTPLSRKVHD